MAPTGEGVGWSGPIPVDEHWGMPPAWHEPVPRDEAAWALGSLGVGCATTQGEVGSGPWFRWILCKLDEPCARARVPRAAL